MTKKMKENILFGFVIVLIVLGVIALLALALKALGVV